MTTPRRATSVSRRAALAGLGAGGLGLALAATSRHAAAQDATSEAMASHPIVGTWNAMTPGGPALAVFSADGTVIIVVPASQAGPQGVTFVSAQPGTWEPISARGVHFTGVQLHSDASGTYTGSVTIDGYPVVSEDGQTILDDQSQGNFTMRDAAGAVVQEMPTAGAPPVTGARIGVGSPGFPEGTPAASTPTA
jgi:hypothetical protein